MAEKGGGGKKIRGKVFCNGIHCSPSFVTSMCKSSYFSPLYSTFLHSVAGEMSYLRVHFHCSRQRICPLNTLSINGKLIQQFKLQEIQTSHVGPFSNVLTFWFTKWDTFRNKCKFIQDLRSAGYWKRNVRWMFSAFIKYLLISVHSMD